MTILENIRFPLNMRRVERDVAAQKIERVLDMMRITELAQQYPNQLSGGQQQRVALARAMVCSDDLILFDEPLSNVDAKVRDHLRTELSVMQKQHGFTPIYVTHDQDEAMSLADRVVVLGEGRIWQAGTPREVYHKPSDARVAAFFGAANLLPGKLVKSGGQTVVQTALGDIGGPTFVADNSGPDILLMSRPESWRLDRDRHESSLGWKGEIRLVTHLGPHTDYVVEIAGHELRMRDYGARQLAIGDDVWCAIEPADLLVVDARR